MIKNLNIVITGTSRGVGLELTKKLLIYGNNVWGCSRNKSNISNKKYFHTRLDLCKEKNYESIFPPLELCGDNAAMIGMVGLEKFKLNQFNDLDYPAKPRWPLDEKANFLKGAGVKL